MSEIRPEAKLIDRIMRFPLTLLIIEFGMVVLAATLASTISRKAGLVGQGPMTVAGALLVALAAAGTYAFCRAAIEGHRGAGELPLDGGGALELGAGLGGGFVLFSAMAGIVALLGGLEVIGSRWPGQVWSLIAMAVVSGVVEEVLFRGIVLRHLETMLGSWAALAITSALFGLGHLGNANATVFSSLAIALEAGLLLGGAFLLTRRLWAAIGLHAAWNFTQGWVFSIPVSGGKVPIGVLITRREGPDWLTGGAFGLEASAVAMVVATLAGIALVAMAARRGRIAPPMWAKPLQTNE